MNKKLNKYIKTHLKKGHSAEKIQNHIVKQGVHPTRAEEAVTYVLKKLENNKRFRYLAIFVVAILIVGGGMGYLFLNAPPPKINEISKDLCAMPDGLSCESVTKKNGEIEITLTNELESTLSNVRIELEDGCSPVNISVAPLTKELFVCKGTKKQQGKTYVSPVTVFYTIRDTNSTHEATGSITAKIE